MTKSLKKETSVKSFIWVYEAGEETAYCNDSYKYLADLYNSRPDHNAGLVFNKEYDYVRFIFS